jgi:hypothetical protein
MDRRKKAEMTMVNEISNISLNTYNATLFFVAFVLAGPLAFRMALVGLRAALFCLVVGFAMVGFSLSIVNDDEKCAFLKGICTSCETERVGVYLSRPYIQIGIRENRN